MACEFVTLRDGSEPHAALLPPGHNVHYTDDSKTPVDIDGSFLFGSDRRATDGSRIPIDPVTGLPHAILPMYVAPHPNHRRTVNYHHHFYNRRHPDLEGDLRLTDDHFQNPENIPLDAIAGLAVRMSRGQQLPIGTHELIHRRYAQGPKLPHTIDEKFVTAVKACSGVVSRWALDVTAPKGRELVYMDDIVFEKVASPKLLCVERANHDKLANDRRRVLGNFFLRYAALQDLGHISERHIDEFLNTADDKRRLAVGNYILREAVEVSIAPLVPMYRELKQQGMVQPGKSDLSTAIWKYVHPHRRDSVFPVLEGSLAA